MEQWADVAIQNSVLRFTRGDSRVRGWLSSYLDPTVRRILP